MIQKFNETLYLNYNLKSWRTSPISLSSAIKSFYASFAVRNMKICKNLNIEVISVATYYLSYINIYKHYRAMCSDDTSAII